MPEVSAGPTDQKSSHYLTGRREFPSSLLCFYMVWLAQRLSLQWRHNERDSVSAHQPLDYFPNRLFRPRSKKTSKLRVTGFCAGNSPVTGEFPTQRASNAENVSIWWRHHVLSLVMWVTNEFKSYSVIRENNGWTTTLVTKILLPLDHMALFIYAIVTSLPLRQGNHCHCRWSNLEEYGKMHQVNKQWNYDINITLQHNKQLIVRVFLGE